MDTDRQRQLEWFRRVIPFVGGILMVMAGNWALFAGGTEQASIVAVIASVGIIGGVFFLALGVGSARYRRWMFSVEDRIKALEQELEHARNHGAR